MYTMVLMAALSSGTDLPDCHHSGGCYGGCYGASYYGGCYGCGGGCYGCYGGCYGCGGGCYGRAACYGCGGYSCYGCGGGCYGWAVSNYAGGAGYGCGGYAVSNVAVQTNSSRGEMVKGERRNASELINTRARLRINFPADAKLMVNGTTIQNIPADRTFLTQVLEPGRTYTYNLRAEAVRDGRTVHVERTIHVKPGKLTKVTLPLSDKSVARR